MAAELDASPGVSNIGLRLTTGAEESVVLRWSAGGIMNLDRSRSEKVDFHPKFSGAFESPEVSPGRRHRFRLIIDTSSIELFDNDGETCVTSLFLPMGKDRLFQLEGAPSSLKVKKLEIWELRSAMP